MTLDPIERLTLVFSAGAVALSWVIASPGFAVSLGAGALLEAVNFRGLLGSAKLLFGGEVSGSRPYIGFFGLRFAILAVGIGAALSVGADPAALVIGLSLVMPASVIVAWRNRPAIDPNAPSFEVDDPEWKDWNPWMAQERDPADDDEEELEA